MTMNPFLENYLLVWQIFQIPFYHIIPGLVVWNI